jgi:hypothetical protein
LLRQLVSTSAITAGLPASCDKLWAASTTLAPNLRAWAMRSLTLQAVAPGVAWGDLCERVAHAPGLKNGRWGAVDVLDQRLGLGGRLVDQSERREFCLDVWWSAFLLDLLARKVIRWVPGSGRLPVARL